MGISKSGSSSEVHEAAAASEVNENYVERDDYINENDIPDDYIEQPDPEGLTGDEIDIEADDNGDIYKINGELEPNTEYELGGVTYETNEYGNIVSWEGEVSYTPDNERDNKAQLEAGGKDRLAGDDGGHLVARIHGGNDGIENMVPMRDTINRGDYKSAENEITTALKNGETVTERGTVKYDGESGRPYEFSMEYEYGDVKKELTCDNVEGSTELLKDVRSEVDPKEFREFQDDIKSMQDEGDVVSVTSVMKEYDQDGNLTHITVKYRNETEGEKMSTGFDVNPR